MGYKKSAARSEFDALNHRALKIVAKATKKYAVRTDLSDYSLCAALLLVHAHFENYIKDICDLFVHNVNQKGLTADALPGRLRECALLASFPHQDFQLFYAFGDERALLDKLSSVRHSPGWNWCRSDFIGMVSVEAVLGDCGYPSSKNVRKLFYKLGIQNIYAELGKRLRTDVESLLDGIGGLRCEMAHVGMPPLVTAGDIAEKIRKLSRVVDCLDRIIQKHANAVKA